MKKLIFMKLDETCRSAPKYVHLPHKHAHSYFHLLFYESSFLLEPGLNYIPALVQPTYPDELMGGKTSLVWPAGDV